MEAMMVDWLAVASTQPGLFSKSPGSCALGAMMVADVVMPVAMMGDWLAVVETAC